MDRRLVDVSQAGNIDAFHALLEDEPQILDYIDEVPYTRTPLHIAILARKPEFANEIASLKPSFITKLDRFGYNPIHLASENGQVVMVKSLLEKLEPIKEFTKGKENRTPLHFAVISGKIDVVNFLVKNYPNCIMDLTIRNESVFHLAVKNKHLGVFLVLLEYLKVYKGVLTLMCDNVYSSLEMDKGVINDILNYKDDEGNTILHLATMMKQPQMVEALLSSCTSSTGILQVDVNTLNAKNMSALDIIQQLPEDKRGRKIEEILRRVGAQTRGTTILQ